MTRPIACACLGIAFLVYGAPPAAAVQWKYPPGPPYRVCTDTLKIFSVQNPDTVAAPCHPALMDTVWGVRGIITAFDAKPSAFSFYIQNSFADGPHPWTGVDVFTGATNYNSSVPGTPTGGNLALGDSVVVYGTTQEFPNPNGETEIEGPDVNQATNDIIIRRINSGNPLPAAKVGTTHDFNWSPAISGTTAEPWEGCLVRINGPLHVARVSGAPALGSNAFLIVSNASPSDSVLIEGLTLTTFAPPPVNTNIDFVQGILNQRTISSVNSYRIQLRDVNDISVSVPPSLVDAYSLEDNKLRLVFDRNLDLSTAQNPSNYSLASGIGGSTVNTATVVGGAGAKVDLGITSVLTDGALESISEHGVGSANCPSCLSSTQSQTFFNGVMTIAMLQAPNPDSLSGACVDRSRFAGSAATAGMRVTVRGVATQNYGSLYYIEDPAGGPRSGVSVFGPSAVLVPGHKYRIAASVQEFAGETELVNSADITDEGWGSVPVKEQTIHVLANATCDASQNLDTGEDWEGVLVTLGHAMVVNFNTPPVDPGPGASFRIVQPPGLAATDTILVSSQGGHYVYDPTAGDIVDVTGILHENGTFRILPRSDFDISPALKLLGGAAKYAVDAGNVLCYQPSPSGALTILGKPGTVVRGPTAQGIVDVLLSNESLDFEVELADSFPTSPALKARVLSAPTLAQLKANILDSLQATADTSHLTTLQLSITPANTLDTLVLMPVLHNDQKVAGFAFYSPNADSVAFVQIISGDSIALYAHDSLIAVARGDSVNGITAIVGSDGPSPGSEPLLRAADPSEILATFKSRKLKAFMKRNFGKKFREALREEIQKPKTVSCYVSVVGTAATGAGIGVAAIEASLCTANLLYKAWYKGRHNIYGISNSTTLRPDGSFMMTVPAGMGWDGSKHVIALGLADESVPQNSLVGTTLVLGTCSSSGAWVPLEDARTTRLLPNAPNPFASRTSIPFTLAQPSRVEIRIFDLAGRRLRTLDLGALAAGPHRTYWDGTGVNGELLRPGIYFVRLLVNGIGEATRDVVMVR